MRQDQGKTCQHEHSGRKRRRENSNLDSYMDEFGKRDGNVNGINTCHTSSQTKNVWLMVVDSLRKEVLAAVDRHRADTLARSKVPTTAPPSPLYKCNLCQVNQAMSKTLCQNFLCWKCLCKWHKKRRSKKFCPCCRTVIKHCHITLLDEKSSDDDHYRRTMDEFPTGLTPLINRASEMLPIWTEDFPNAPARFDQPNPFLTQQPTSPTSLITGLDSCSSLLYSDPAFPDIEWLDMLAAPEGLSSNAEESSTSLITGLHSCSSLHFSDHVLPDIEWLGKFSAQEALSSNAEKWLDKFSARQSLSSNAGASEIGLKNSSLMATQLSCTQGHKLEQYSDSSNLVAEAIRSSDISNRDDAWYLDSFLDEATWVSSFLDEVLPL